MSDLNDKEIEFWLKHGYNVLLRGKHGVGKTARILDAFEKAGLKYQYFSTSTMDPWVDFIGVPKEMTNENGETYLGLVRPKQFAEDQVEAIFLDEFNRSSKKVRNAVLELIQFKSINGKVFKNLKVVWAAINPEDEEKTYDVEALDPAQLDRFHMIVDVPYMPSLDYFKAKYGEQNAKAAIEWWQSLEMAQKDLVSPRRLDYALDVFEKNGNIRSVLSGKGVPTTQLLNVLKKGSIVDRIEEFMKTKDKDNARTFLLNENNYNSAIPLILGDKEKTRFFVPLLTDEKIIALMNRNTEIEEQVFANYKDHKDLIEDLAKAGGSELAAKATKSIMLSEPEKQTAGQAAGSIYVTSCTLNIKHDPEKSVDTFLTDHKTLMKKHPLPSADSKTRQLYYDFLVKNVPFDFVSDETQVKGCQVAHAIVDLVTDIALHSRKDVLDKMSDLGKYLNHTMLYMGVFQQEPDADDTNKHDAKSFLIKNPTDVAKAIQKLQNHEVSLNVKQ